MCSLLLCTEIIYGMNYKDSEEAHNDRSELAQLNVASGDTLDDKTIEMQSCIKTNLKNFVNETEVEEIILLLRGYFSTFGVDESTGFSLAIKATDGTEGQLRTVKNVINFFENAKKNYVADSNVKNIVSWVIENASLNIFDMVFDVLNNNTLGLIGNLANYQDITPFIIAFNIMNAYDELELPLPTIDSLLKFVSDTFADISTSSDSLRLKILKLLSNKNKMFELINNIISIKNTKDQLLNILSLLIENNCEKLEKYLDDNRVGLWDVFQIDMSILKYVNLDNRIYYAVSLINRTDVVNSLIECVSKFKTDSRFVRAVLLSISNLFNQLLDEDSNVRNEICDNIWVISYFINLFFEQIAFENELTLKEQQNVSSRFLTEDELNLYKALKDHLDKNEDLDFDVWLDMWFSSQADNSLRLFFIPDKFCELFSKCSQEKGEDILHAICSCYIIGSVDYCECPMKIKNLLCEILISYFKIRVGSETSQKEKVFNEELYGFERCGDSLGDLKSNGDINSIENTYTQYSLPPISTADTQCSFPPISTADTQCSLPPISTAANEDFCDDSSKMFDKESIGNMKLCSCLNEYEKNCMLMSLIAKENVNLQHPLSSKEYQETYGNCNCVFQFKINEQSYSIGEWANDAMQNSVNNSCFYISLGVTRAAFLLDAKNWMKKQNGEDQQIWLESFNSSYNLMYDNIYQAINHVVMECDAADPVIALAINMYELQDRLFIITNTREFSCCKTLRYNEETESIEAADVDVLDVLKSSENIILKHYGKMMEHFQRLNLLAIEAEI